MKAPDLAPAPARRALAGVSNVASLDDAAVLDRYARTVWSAVAEPGDGVAGRLVAALGPVDALASATGAAPSARHGLSGGELDEGRKRWSPRLASAGLGDGVRIAAASGIRLVVPDDPEWPEQLDDLGPHAPFCLWVRGDVATLARLRPSVAIVGARASTSYGDHVAMELAADLGGSGIPIVSGAAYGIDGAAHRAALTVGGTTVALLAGGADRAYPAGHSGLIDRIARDGAVVSEVPCGSMPTKWRFLQRNRLIAALADATVVVEAGWRSGSLNTAGHALELSRALGAVPGPITSAASAGSHKLFRDYGAQCITSGDDVREMLGLHARASQPSQRDGRPPTDAATRVRDALSTRAWRDASDLARRSGMARDEVEAILGVLHLDDEVEHGPSGWRSVGGGRAGR